MSVPYREAEKDGQTLKTLALFSKFRFTVHVEIGVGGKYGMRKEGHELLGMKERTEGQSNVGGEAAVIRGHVASPCTCSLRCTEAGCSVEAPAQKDSLSSLQTLANAIERKLV